MVHRTGASQEHHRRDDSDNGEIRDYADGQKVPRRSCLRTTIDVR